MDGEEQGHDSARLRHRGRDEHRSWGKIRGVEQGQAPWSEAEGDLEQAGKDLGWGRKMGRTAGDCRQEGAGRPLQQ